MILLDTNIVIAVLNNQAVEIRRRLDVERAQRGTIALPSVVAFELWWGAYNSQHPAPNLARLRGLLPDFTHLPFDAEDAQTAGEIRADLAVRGTPIGPYDLLIAAQALRRDAVLVTANRREFSRIRGLRLEDWTTIRPLK